MIPDYYAAKVVKWRWLTYPWALTEDLGEFARTLSPPPADLQGLQQGLLSQYGLDVPKAKLVDVLANLQTK